jgi:hypothetical protein
MDKPLLQDSEFELKSHSTDTYDVGPKLLEETDIPILNDNEQSISNSTILDRFTSIYKSKFVQFIAILAVGIAVRDPMWRAQNYVGDVVNYFTNKPKSSVAFDLVTFWQQECAVAAQDADLKNWDFGKMTFYFRTPSNRDHYRYVAYAVSEDGKSLQYFGSLQGGDKPAQFTSREDLKVALCGDTKTIEAGKPENSPPEVHNAGPQFTALLQEMYKAKSSLPFYKAFQQKGASLKEHQVVFMTVTYDPVKKKISSQNITNDSGGFILNVDSAFQNRKKKPFSVNLIFAIDQQRNVDYATIREIFGIK